MNRDIDREGREPAERVAPERTPEPRELPEQRELSREREPVRQRNRVWRISEAERQTMLEVGRFRTVALEDLLKHRYRGQAAEMWDDLQSLSAQGLVQRRGASIGKRRGNLEVLVLTQAAKKMLEQEHPDASQKIYAGFVKPSEVGHDAAIYRMFQAEARRLERMGATIRRVVLDYELKQKLYSPLAKAKTLPVAEYVKRQAAVARDYGLKVVQRRIMLPDLRIEYQTRDGNLARVDLELATEHYHGSHLAAKAQAGFRFYVADGSAGRLSRVMEEREITASILSL